VMKDWGFGRLGDMADTPARELMDG